MPTCYFMNCAHFWVVPWWWLGWFAVVYVGNANQRPKKT